MNGNRPTYGDEGKPGTPAENSAPGLNDNLEFMGRRLHIQTERIGLPSPHIVTQVFSNGRVIFSKKSEIPQEEAHQESAQIQERMHAQHLETMREIEAKQKRALNSQSASSSIAQAK